MTGPKPASWTIVRDVQLIAALAVCAPISGAYAQYNQSGSYGSGTAGNESGEQGGYSHPSGGSGSTSGQPSSAGYPGHGGGKGGDGGGAGGSGATSGSSAAGSYGHGGAYGQASSGGYAGHGGGQAPTVGMHTPGGYPEGSGHDVHGRVHGEWRAPGFDRSNPRWWQGRQEFNGYAGHRVGFFFVPGYGYRPVPLAYSGRAWSVGAVLPPELRGYAVADPSVYGVDPAPAGYRWIYVDDGVALIDNGRGVIVRSVWHIW